MDSFVTKIQDLQQQLIATDEVLPDSTRVQTVLNGLPDSYQSFASTLHLMMKGNQNALLFEELVFVLLQEEQSRQNRNIMRIADQAFAASHKGKGKFKPKSVTSAKNAKKSEKYEKKTEKKVRCNYCKTLG